MAKVSNIVFVHGAWANSSAWDKVRPLVEAAGLKGTAVSLALNSLPDDTAIAFSTESNCLENSSTFWLSYSLNAKMLVTAAATRVSGSE
jgi:hypothetical protein